MTVPTNTTDIGHGIVLPEPFVQTLNGLHGRDATQHWLGTLPEVLGRWIVNHSLTLEPTLPELNFNLVIFATDARGRRLVLKLSRPWHEFMAEIQGMKELRGVESFVQLIDADAGDAAVLMERVEPGTSLLSANLPDEEATTIAAGLAPDVWRTPSEPGALIPLRTWLHALFREAETPSSEAIPAELLQTAVDIADSLFATMPDEAVLHGDLHHQNILWDRDFGWKMIDLKGITGDPAYDISTWMLNPWGNPASLGHDLPALYARRLTIFESEMGLARERMLDWAIVHSVVSACWSLKGNIPQDVTSTLQCTEALLSLREA